MIQHDIQENFKVLRHLESAEFEIPQEPKSLEETKVHEN